MAAKAINVSGEDMEAPRFDTTTEGESYGVTEEPKSNDGPGNDRAVS